MRVSSPSCFIDYIIKNKKIWKIQLLFQCLGGLRYKECIPYQGNEHLLGTNKSK